MEVPRVGQGRLLGGTERDADGREELRAIGFERVERAGFHEGFHDAPVDDACIDARTEIEEVAKGSAALAGREDVVAETSPRVLGSELLRRTLASVAPAKCDREPTIVILTPGHFNSAYYEHSFLADLMGIELVEGQDLFVDGAFVYMRTTSGPQRVDVMYRRLDDNFLDPLAFRPDSALGVPGLFQAYAKGNVVICNAVGTGVADDKSIYPYVPDMIKYYLDEEPILNNVTTYQCRKPADLSYVLANMKDLVVKEVHGAGGYGMLVGPAATAKEVEEFAAVVKANPSNYIAQPTLSLSSCPTFVESGIAPRHIDLRPFVLTGRSVRMVPGGLTRVALREGSLVVNSSQGGGTKDTWVLGDEGDGDVVRQASNMEGK